MLLRGQLGDPATACIEWLIGGDAARGEPVSVDRMIRFATAAVVCAVAAFAAVVSYSHIYGRPGRARAVAFIGSVDIAMQQVRRAWVPRAATIVPAVPGDVQRAAIARSSWLPSTLPAPPRPSSKCL